MSGLVDVIIVNWNSGPLLAACLRTLEAEGSGSIASVVVVDNASSDDSSAVAAPALPLTMVHNRDNIGFGRACNVGAAKGAAPYILFLNPDSEAFPGVLAELIEEIEKPENERTGILGIRLVNDLGETQRHCARFPDWRNFVAESTGLAKFFPHTFKSIIMTEFDHCSDADVDHVIGAFYFVRRQVFERVNGFDPGYFVYLEDLDLSLRIARLGYKCRYVAHISSYHKGAGTSDAIRARRLSYVTLSRLTYARRHFGLPGRAAVAFAALALEPFARSLEALSRVSVRDLFAVWQGYGMAYLALAKRLANR